jgi:hypothetical protein
MASGLHDITVGGGTNSVQLHQTRVSQVRRRNCVVRQDVAFSVLAFEPFTKAKLIPKPAK